MTVKNDVIIDEAFISMKKSPAFAEYIHWQELKDRILVLNDQIDDLVIEDYIMPIIKWNKEDDNAEFKYFEQYPDPNNRPPMEKRKPITIYLNSPGGDLFSGLILADVIKKSKTPVHIYVLSMAASMGSVILSAGHWRVANQYSNILIHDGSTGIAGTSNKVKDHMKYFDKKKEQIRDFIVSNSRITRERYDEMDDREWWLTAQEALELGLVDIIE